MLEKEQRILEPTRSRRSCSFTPHATNLPLAGLFVAYSVCDMIMQLGKKRSSINTKLKEGISLPIMAGVNELIPLQCFYTGTRTSSLIRWPGQARAAAWLDVYVNVLSEKKTFLRLPTLEECSTLKPHFSKEWLNSTVFSLA